jgi:hypothetical protein
MMTRSEWHSCTDPQEMLEFLQNSGRWNERKLRLFSCACVRRIWGLLDDERSRKAVDIAECFSDSKVGRAELTAARAAADRAHFEAPRRANFRALDAAPHTAEEDLSCSAADAAVSAADAVQIAAGGDEMAKVEECQQQTRLLRCIFPNPFRDIPTIEGRWLAWNDGTVQRMANTIYEQRQLPSSHLDPVHLAVLADSLEEAGCHDGEILSHLRQQGVVHVRGCWVIDLLLNKK